jgi:hypothetical protein
VEQRANATVRRGTREPERSVVRPVLVGDDLAGDVAAAGFQFDLTADPLFGQDALLDEAVEGLLDGLDVHADEVRDLEQRDAGVQRHQHLSLAVGDVQVLGPFFPFEFVQ